MKAAEMFLFYLFNLILAKYSLNSRTPKFTTMALIKTQQPHAVINIRRQLTERYAQRKTTYKLM